MAGALGACSPASFDSLVGDAYTSDAGLSEAPATSATTDRQVRAASGEPSTDHARDAEPPDAGDDRDHARAAEKPAPAEPLDCETAVNPSQVSVSVSEPKRLPTPSSLKWRAGAASLRLADRILWLFETDADPIADWSRARDLRASTPRFDSPSAFQPLLASSASPTGRVVPGGLVPKDGDEAWLFFAGYDGSTPLGEGLAQIAKDAPAAEIVHSIGATDDGTWHPIFHQGAFLDDKTSGGFVYLYACDANPDQAEEQPGQAHAQPCRIARVPPPDVELRGSYRYFDGAAWVSDSAKAAVVIDRVPGNLSVSYNRYLQCYLAVHSGDDNDVRLRWADHPEGPWRELGQFATEIQGAVGTSHGALEHTSLREPCAKTTYVSYVRSVQSVQPTDTDDDDADAEPSFETYLVRVELD